MTENNNVENIQENKTPKKHKKKLKKPIYIILIIILLCVAGFSGYKIISTKLNESNAVKEEATLQLPEVTVDNTADYKTTFAAFKQMNERFLGWIVFDSGLVNQPFVKGEDNDYYLTHGFKNTYSIYGTVFQDYLQSLEGQNITLFGHYVYSNSEIMFTPLTTLANKDNYEANKNFSLNLENEKRNYVVCAVIQYDEADEPLYQVGDFSVEQAKQFISYINTNKVYDTGVTISENDKFLTLQTCVRNNESKRWIIIGKLESVESID